MARVELVMVAGRLSLEKMVEKAGSWYSVKKFFRLKGKFKFRYFMKVTN